LPFSPRSTYSRRGSYQALAVPSQGVGRRPAAIAILEAHKNREWRCCLAVNGLYLRDKTSVQREPLRSAKCADTAGRPVDPLYLLTPRCRVLPEQLTGLQLVKKFPAFHGARRFITALTSARHLSLSWANPIQSTVTLYTMENSSPFMGDPAPTVDRHTTTASSGRHIQRVVTLSLRSVNQHRPIIC